MTIKELLIQSSKELRETGVSETESSVNVLLGDATNMTRTEIIANPEKEVTKAQQKKFEKFIERRKKHESVWHIIGRVPFWGLEFLIDKNVLVPRPETELLIEKVINEVMIRRYKVNGLLDVGTGSGTIAVTLASEFPEIEITASDVSGKALKVAEKNAKHNAAQNIEFIHSDLFENIKGKFDIITANLPYIPEEEMESLSVDVHHYEPKLALSGGKGGLEIYEKFLKDVSSHINLGGVIFCEIGHDQGKEFKKIVRKYLPKSSCEVVSDFAEVDRIVIIDVSR